MKIDVAGGLVVDTETDLSAAERHILQKLFGWKTMVSSLDEFRDKTAKAFRTGWGDSGPVRPSQKLVLVINKLEEQLLARLRDEKARGPGVQH